MSTNPATLSEVQPDGFFTRGLADADPARMNYLSMITGPSRTADIERVLTIGVHGPVRLIIIFVDELGRTN